MEEVDERLFPNTCGKKKWHHCHRNMKIGDIVLVQDNRISSGVWKMAEVVEATPGKDGKVGYVCIRYKFNKFSNMYHGESDIKV